MAAGDGSEEVNDFLQRIKELGNRRDQEDEERNRRLEQEILQGRKERQARRAERTRSLSPIKSSTPNTPTSGSPVVHSGHLSDSMFPLQNPQRDSALGDAPIEDPNMTSQLDDGGSEQEISAAMSSSSSPLSWQRRPTSQITDRQRHHPLSMVADSAAESTPSRDETAQSLASKDPAWFRQTADRGTGSPAHRRIHSEDSESFYHGSPAAKFQLPGFSSQPTMSSRSRPISETRDKTISPVKSSGDSETGSISSHLPGSTSPSKLGSPMPLTSAQKLDPPDEEYRSEARSLAMSPSQGRISPDRLDRPVSPTKGMGGFVQSAMMKRSDSLNKRWSVQSPPGLKRGDSVISNRSSKDSSLTMGSFTNSRPSSPVKPPAPRPLSRPGSSHSNATVTQEIPRHDSLSSIPKSPNTSTTDGEVLLNSATPALEPENSTNEVRSQEGTGTVSVSLATTPPSSAPKTTDPRRWSPTKPSWLDNALNKPETPRAKASPAPQQPAWMAEINKAKNKDNVIESRTPTNKHQVSIGGLLRSPALGALPRPQAASGAFNVPTDTLVKKPFIINKSLRATTPDNSEHIPEESGTSCPAVNKAKPVTPPKKDLRSILKPRQMPVESSGLPEPEFKNVFGQLRKTKRQNYVAPDVLKDNITRGKAALNLTGGPKMTERADDFRDALLKKKEIFKKAQSEGRGVTRIASGGSQTSTIPEAIVKRQVLGRTDSNRTGNVMDTPVVTPPDIATSTPLHQKSSAPDCLQGKEAVGSRLASRFNPALAGLLARGPPSVVSDTSRSASIASSKRTISMSTSTTNADNTEHGPQLEHLTKGRARGPRRKVPTSVSASDPPKTESRDIILADNTDIRRSTSIHSSSRSDESVYKPKLTLEIEREDLTAEPVPPRRLDMKRQSQFLQESSSNTSKEESATASSRPCSPTKKSPSLSDKTNLSQEHSTASLRPSTAMNKILSLDKVPDSKPLAVKTIASPIELSVPETSKSPKPTTNTVSPSPKRSITQPSQLSVDTNFSPSMLSLVKSGLTPSPDSPNSQSDQGETPFDQQKISELSSSGSVKNPAVSWSDSMASDTKKEWPRVISPFKATFGKEEKPAMIAAARRPVSPIKGKESYSEPSKAQKAINSPEAMGLGIQSGGRPLPTPPTTTSWSVESKVSYDSAIPCISEASKLVAEFFSTQAKAYDFNADTATILSNRPHQSSNIKTLRSTLYQLSAEGKRQPVPSHQERLLFEAGLYLCIHNFSDAAGKRITEVYYWSGDSVPVSTVKEVGILAQREARDAGGKLVEIQQGKEPLEFLHALGGVVIIRRGSSNKYDSLAPHILCARRQFGQVVFDEVDFTAASLCSGFSYLVSTQSGKCYLWKGKGSGIDELSCARLVGMELGLTGEIEEIEDGKEPATFVQIFGTDVTIPKSADHWRLKPNYSKYCARLFRANPNSTSQITEITPFSQADLVLTGIYVLDAFFEVYIMIGSRSRDQYAAFHIALHFAQEYGILAAGMEDRPHVPTSTVVFGGAPRDLKSVFRKWRDELTPMSMTPAEGSALQRGRSLRVVPLTSALEALRL